MFAVIKTGGKQYKVRENDKVIVEKLPGNAGDTVNLTEVLALGEGAQVTLGSPVVQGATVTATILEQKQTDKVIVFKKKRRQGYRRKAGHRQEVTCLSIESISASGAPKAPKAKVETSVKAEPKKAEASVKAEKAPAKAPKKTEKAPKAASKTTKA